MRFVVVLFLRQEMAAGVTDDEEGRNEDDDQGNGGSSDDHSEVGVFVAALRDVRGGRVGHIRWDAGDAVEAYLGFQSTQDGPPKGTEARPGCGVQDPGESYQW